MAADKPTHTLKHYAFEHVICGEKRLGYYCDWHSMLINDAIMNGEPTVTVWHTVRHGANKGTMRAHEINLVKREVKCGPNTWPLRDFSVRETDRLLSIMQETSKALKERMDTDDFAALMIKFKEL